MNILYESVTVFSWLFVVSVFVAVFAAIGGIAWIATCLTDGEWTRACTGWLAAISISILLAIFMYNAAPKKRFIRVDVSSITDWDVIIEKYDTGKITGKVLELTEKEPLE